MGMEKRNKDYSHISYYWYYFWYSTYSFIEIFERDFIITKHLTVLLFIGLVFWGCEKQQNENRGRYYFV